MIRLAAMVALSASLLPFVGAGAQDRQRPLSAYSTVDELVAVLDADEDTGIAYVSGTLGALLLRSSQGDPMLWWVRDCMARTYLSAESLVPGVRGWAAEHGDAPPIANFASNAILSVMAQFCGEAEGTSE